MILEKNWLIAGNSLNKLAVRVICMLYLVQSKCLHIQGVAQKSAPNCILMTYEICPRII